MRPAQCAAGTAEPSACGRQCGRHMKWYMEGYGTAAWRPPPSTRVHGKYCQYRSDAHHMKTIAHPWPAEALPTPWFAHVGHAYMPDLNTTPLPSCVCSPQRYILRARSFLGLKGRRSCTFSDDDTAEGLATQGNP